MNPQISEGFGSGWLLINNDGEMVMHGKEGVAVILFPETDAPSFLAIKKLYESLPKDSDIKQQLAGIINRIDKQQQEIMGAGAWEK